MRLRRRTFIAGLGSATAWPLAVRAQQRLPVVGFVSGFSATDLIEYRAFFRQGLAELGYVEGRNLAIEYRWADGRFDRLPSLVADLVQRQVDIIVISNTTAAAIAAQEATQSIPIVFQVGSDPVNVGLVASLNRPGGNLTGIVALQTAVIAKRLQLLVDLVPDPKLIGFLVNPVNRALADADTTEALTAARALGTNLLVLHASSPSDIDEAFETLVRHRADGFLTNSENYFMIRRVQFAVLAARYAMPAIYAYRENALAGGLMSYGADILDGARLTAGYTGRILRGERPNHLPVQQITKIGLAINIKTAKALGLSFPLSLLGRADEVIE